MAVTVSCEDLIVVSGGSEVSCSGREPKSGVGVVGGADSLLRVDRVLLAAFSLGAGKWFRSMRFSPSEDSKRGSRN